MQQEIDGGIADVGAALGDAKYLAPFFRIPGLDRSTALESQLADRSLVVFSSDTVADDWHHGITPNQITALALSRLEARGKGILLLHDIHPKTVAALPGLLKALKDNGFRIVQAVPSAAYLTAMAAKPKARVIASATVQQLAIGGRIGSDGGQPAWPQAPAEFDRRFDRRRCRIAGPRRIGFRTGVRRCRQRRRRSLARSANQDRC